MDNNGFKKFISSNSSDSNNGNNKLAKIGLIALVIVAIIGAGIYLLAPSFSGKGGKNSGEHSSGGEGGKHILSSKALELAKADRGLVYAIADSNFYQIAASLKLENPQNVTYRTYTNGAGEEVYVSSIKYEAYEKAIKKLYTDDYYKNNVNKGDYLYAEHTDTGDFLAFKNRREDTGIYMEVCDQEESSANVFKTNVAFYQSCAGYYVGKNNEDGTHAYEAYKKDLTYKFTILEGNIPVISEISE